jgi:hypothetical protein
LAEKTFAEMEETRHARPWDDLMKLTNDSYVILIGTKNFTESYYRDKKGWLKVSSRKRTFRMTAEQVLNHVLPALAGIKPNLTIKVEHRSPAMKQRTSASSLLRTRHAPCGARLAPAPESAEA